MTYVAAAVLALASIAGCTDGDTQRFLFVSKDGVSTADIDVSCTCDQLVFDDGACEYAREDCGCAPARAGSLEAVRDDGGVVPQNDGGYVPGDFAGARVRIDADGDSTVVRLPAAYPPPPHIVSARAGVTSWVLERQEAVQFSTADYRGLQTCRVGASASATHNTRAVAPIGLGLLAVEEVPGEHAGVRILMFSAADYEPPPGPPMPQPGIPTPDPKHLRVP